MSAPVPDIDDLLFKMESLHQQCVRNGIIREKIVDSFMESLDKFSEEQKLEKVQRRIQLITKRLSESTPTSSFANGGEISEKSPVQSQSNSLAPVQVKQEFAHPAAGFASNFAASLGREKFTARSKPTPTQPLVVIGRGHTAVKNFMRLRLQKFVSPVYPQPQVRVMARVSTTKH